MKKYILKLLLAVSIIMASTASSWAQIQSAPKLTYKIKGNKVRIQHNGEHCIYKELNIDECRYYDSCTALIYYYDRPISKDLKNKFPIKVDFIALNSNNELFFQKTLNVNKYTQKENMIKITQMINENDSEGIIIKLDPITHKAKLIEYGYISNNSLKLHYACSL